MTSAVIAAAAIIAVSAPAPAGTSARRHEIDLPGGELGAAVIRLGRQTGASIGIGDRELARIRVARLRGRYTVNEALGRLLKGTTADYRRVGRDSWRIAGRAGQPASTAPAHRPETAAPAPAPPEEPVDIIVTGSKRPVLLRDYAGSIDLLDGQELAPSEWAQGTQAIAARIPSLGSTHLGSGRNKLFIRGIADSSFNGPTQATVGQYLGEVRLNYNAPDPDLRLYDIRSVEVLKGPQGTLYGAGSIGGILRLVPEPADPSFAGATASAALTQTAHGGFGHEVGGTVNLPLAEDVLGLRGVAYFADSAGYIDDSRRRLEDVNDSRVSGGRLSVRWAPSERWIIDLSGTLQVLRADDSQYADRDAPPLTRASNLAQPFSNDYGLASLTIRREWGDLAFVSATGLVRQRLDETYDASQPGEPPSLFRQVNDVSMLSFENRLTRESEEGGAWLAGWSFIRNRSEVDRRLETLESRSPSLLTGVDNGIDEATLFGEFSPRLSEGFSLTLGSRVTHARLSGRATNSPREVIARNEAVRAARAETTFLPSAALSYSPADGMTFFLRYEEGFRPGGLSLNGDVVQRFRNDDAASAEAGFRYGDRLDEFYLAASAAYTRWHDIQADAVDGTGLPATFNIGDGRIYSFDLAALWRPARGLLVELGAVYNDSKVTDPAPSIIIVPTSSLPNVARLNGRAALEYSAPLGERLDLKASAWARYVGKSRLGIGPVLGETQGDYLDTGLHARVGTQGSGVTLGITNLFDSQGNRFALGSPFTIVHGPQITPMRPRTVSLGLDASF